MIRPVPPNAADAYENLRNSALGNMGPQHHPSGWAVLVRCGMAEWLYTLAELPPLKAHQKKTANIVSLAGSLRDEIVSVMAGMVFELHQEVIYAI